MYKSRQVEVHGYQYLLTPMVADLFVLIEYPKWGHHSYTFGLLHVEL